MNIKAILAGGRVSLLPFYRRRRTRKVLVQLKIPTIYNERLKHHNGLIPTKYGKKSTPNTDMLVSSVAATMASLLHWKTGELCDI